MILLTRHNLFLRQNWEKKLKSKEASYLPLLGTLGGSRKKMAKNIIPEVATNKNV